MGQIVAAMATTKPKDAGLLVAVGAHLVGALMAIHVLQFEQRRMMRGAA